MFFIRAKKNTLKEINESDLHTVLSLLPLLLFPFLPLLFLACLFLTLIKHSLKPADYIMLFDLGTPTKV